MKVADGHSTAPRNIGRDGYILLKILGPDNADTSPNAFIRGTGVMPLLDSQRKGVRDGSFPFSFLSEIDPHPFLPTIVSLCDAYFLPSLPFRP